MKKSYTEKTERIRAWSEFADNTGHLLSKSLWIVLIILVLASLGRYIPRREQTPTHPSQQSKPVLHQPDWAHIDREIVAAVEKSRAASEEFASRALDAWTATLMDRVDKEFLDWYFGYWHQQILGLKGLYYNTTHVVGIDSRTAADHITEAVQEQFARQVLRPEIAQKELENLTRDIVSHYVAGLQNDLRALASRYRIPQADWEAHLDAIAAMTAHTEGGRDVALSLKALTTSSAAGMVVVGKALTPTLQALGSKVSTRLAGRAATQMATATGEKIAAKAGGRLFGPIVGIGIIIWDIWDHQATAAANKPMLRRNIHDYVQQVRKQLLYDTESGVMSVVYELEKNISAALPSA